MNSKCVAHGHAFLQNIANTLCFLVLFETRDVRLSNLDSGRNDGNLYVYSAKSIELRIQHSASSRHRKIKLLARARMRSVRRCEIYVLRVDPTLTILDDDFDAKKSGVKMAADRRRDNARSDMELLKAINEGKKGKE